MLKNKYSQSILSKLPQSRRSLLDDRHDCSFFGVLSQVCAIGHCMIGQERDLLSPDLLNWWVCPWFPAFKIQIFLTPWNPGTRGQVCRKRCNLCVDSHPWLGQPTDHKNSATATFTHAPHQKIRGKILPKRQSTSPAKRQSIPLLPKMQPTSPAKKAVFPQKKKQKEEAEEERSNRRTR